MNIDFVLMKRKINKVCTSIQIDFILIKKDQQKYAYIYKYVY